MIFRSPGHSSSWVKVEGLCFTDQRLIIQFKKLWIIKDTLYIAHDIIKEVKKIDLKYQLYTSLLFLLASLFCALIVSAFINTHLNSGGEAKDETPIFFFELLLLPFFVYLSTKYARNAQRASESKGVRITIQSGLPITLFVGNKIILAGKQGSVNELYEFLTQKIK